MLLQTAVAASVGLVIALAMTPVARRVALRLGAVDRPGGRRVHTQVTPRMGGLAVVVAHLVAVGAMMAWGSDPLGKALVTPRPLVGFFGGGLFIALVGAIDDVRPIGAKRKLAGQIAAATIIWMAGGRIEGFDLPWLGSVDFGALASYLLTVGWVLAFVNAVNLIDGLDGLASGITLFVAATNTIVALATGNVVAALLNAALVGSLVGFLYFNFNPATVFLGDTGSLYLGYALSAAALLSGRQKESTVVALLVPLIALGVPLTDTLFTMVRRFLERRPIFAADRGHIHHRLLDLGLTHRRVVLVLYGLTVATCGSALVAAFGKNWVAGLAIAVAAAVVLGGAAFAGYFRTQLRHEREPLSPEAQVLVQAMPELLQRGGPHGLAELCERIEGLVLQHPAFVYADLVTGQGVLWRWGDEQPRSKDDAEYSYTWTINEDTQRLRFVHRSATAERCDRIDVLLQLVADRVKRELAARPIRREAAPRAADLASGELTERPTLT